MGIEEIIRKVEEEAQDESRRIIGEAEKEAEGILEDAREEVRSELEQRRTRLEREIKEAENVILSEGRRKAKREVLKAKEELILKTVGELRKRIASVEGEVLERLLISLLEDVKTRMGEDMIVYPVREMDRGPLSKKMAVEGPLEGRKVLPAQLDLGRGRELLGGFFVISGDGKRAVDMTFDGILERDMEGIRSAVSDELFAEEKEG